MMSIRKVSENYDFPKSEPHTFMTQKRHPVHHFFNFIKFSSLGYCVFYLGQQIVQKVRGTKED